MPENEIYTFLKKNDLTQKSEAEFLEEYSDTAKAKELHGFFESNNLTTKDFDGFYEGYLKKKDETFSQDSVQDSPEVEQASTSPTSGFREVTEFAPKVEVEPEDFVSKEAETKDISPEVKKELDKLPTFTELSDDDIQKAASVYSKSDSDKKTSDVIRDVTGRVETEYARAGILTPIKKIAAYQEAIEPLEAEYLASIGEDFPTEEQRDIYVDKLTEVANGLGGSINDNYEFVVEDDLYSKIITNDVSRILKTMGREEDSFFNDLTDVLNSGMSTASAGVMSTLGKLLALKSIPGYENLAEGQRVMADIASERVSRDMGITSEISEGNYGRALGNMTLQFAQSLPQMLLAASTQNPYAAASIFTATTASEKYDELEDSDLSSAGRFVYSMAYGLTEGLPEAFGTFQVMNKSMQTLIKGIGRETVEDVMKRSIYGELEKYGSQIIGGMNTAFKGGLEEVTTEAMQEVLEGRPFDADRWGDAFLVGMYSDIAMSSPTIAAKTMEDARSLAKLTISKLPKDMPIDAKVNAGKILMEKDVVEQSEAELDPAFKGTATDKTASLNSSVKLTAQPQTVKESVNELNKAINEELAKEYPNTLVLAELESNLSDLDKAIDLAGGDNIKVLDKKIEGLRSERDALYEGVETEVELQQKTTEEKRINSELKDALVEKQKIRNEVYDRSLEGIDNPYLSAVNKETKQKAVEDVSTIKDKALKEEKAQKTQVPTKEEKVVKTEPETPKTKPEPKVKSKTKEDEKVVQDETKVGEDISKEVTEEKIEKSKDKKEEVLVEKKELPKEEVPLKVEPKKKEDAKELESRKVRVEGKKVEKQEVSDKDLPKIDKPKLQDRKKKSIEKIGDITTKDQESLINEAESLEELQHLMSIGKVRMSPEFNKAKEKLVKDNKFDDDSDRISYLEAQTKSIKIEKNDKGETSLRLGKAKIPVKPAPTTKEKVKTFSNVLRDWSKSEKKQIVKGKALYDPSSGRVQVQNIRSAVHEIGHYLDDKNSIVEKIDKNDVDAITDELLVFSETGSEPGKNMSEKDKLRYIQSEGIAEYFTALTINPEEATKMAPKFTKHVNSIVDKKSMDNFRKLSEGIQSFISATPLERTMANVAMETPTASISERINKVFSKTTQFKKTKWMGFIEEFGNRTEVSEQAFRGLIKAQGKKMSDVGGRGDFLKVSRLLYGADNKVYDFIKHGLRDYEGKSIKDGDLKINEDYLFDPISKISKDSKGFRENINLAVSVALNKRIIELKENLDKRQVIEDVSSLKEAEDKGKSIASYKLPSADIMAKYPEVSEEIISKDGATLGEYVDKKRDDGLKSYTDDRYDFSDAIISGTGGGIFGDYEIAQEAVNDFESMKAEDKTTYNAVKETNRRYEEFADATLKYYRDSGRISAKEYQDIKKNNKHYVSFARVKHDDYSDIDFQNYFKVGSDGKVGIVNDVVKAIKGGMSEIQNPYTSLFSNLRNIIFESDRNQAMRSFTDQIDNLSRKIGTEGLNELDIARKVSKKSDGRDGGKYVVKVFVNGEETFYDFNKDIYNSLKEIGHDAPKLNVFVRALSAPMRMLERSVTSFPVFAARNKIRDMQHSLIFTKGKLDIKDYFGNKKGTISELNAAGGGQFGYMLDKKRFETMQSDIATKLTKRDVLVDPRKIGKAWSTYKRGLEWSEASTRAGEYDRVYKAKKAEGMSHADAAVEAAFAARDLMDFSVSGSQVGWLKIIAPFVNPRIQGIRKMYRTSRDNPLKLAGNFAKFAVIPVLLEKTLLHFSDDDDKDRYKKLSNYRKDLFFNLPIGDGFLVIPKPFEAAVLASAFTRGFDKILLDDERPYDNEYGKWLASTLAPVDPTLISGSSNPLLEALNNYDKFRQRSIIPKSEENLPLELRSTFTASRAGQAVQAGTDLAMGLVGGEGIDARKADFLIKGLGTYWGDMAVSVSDIGKPGARNKIDITKTGFYKKDTPYSNEDVIWIQDSVEKYGLRTYAPYNSLKDLIGLYYSTNDKELKKQLKTTIGITAEQVRKAIELIKDSQMAKKKAEVEIKKIKQEIK